MKYIGSKTRIARLILPKILRSRKPGQYYVEPFVGGGNSICQVTGPRIGADVNSHAIAALRLIRDHIDLIPKSEAELNEYQYGMLQYSLGPLASYVGFALSFGGKFFGGWRRGKGIDEVAEAYRSAVKQSKKLQGAQLIFQDYCYLDIPSNSIIYCDPPYQGTQGYGMTFDHSAFWKWCRAKTAEGHKVYISEYNAPEDFKCIFSRQMYSTLDLAIGNKKNIEKLFTLI